MYAITSGCRRHLIPPSRSQNEHPRVKAAPGGVRLSIQHYKYFLLYLILNMATPLDPLYQTKLQLIAVLAVVGGIACLMLAHWSSTTAAPSWLTALTPRSRRWGRGRGPRSGTRFD